MTLTHYILKDGRPVPEPDMKKWHEWMEKHTAKAVARNEVGGWMVSTVFLGIDHGWGNPQDGVEPVVFETMVFDAEGEAKHQERHTTLQEAQIRHAFVLLTLQKELWKQSKLRSVFFLLLALIVIVLFLSPLLPLFLA